MSLGRFGGAAPVLPGVSGFTGGSAMDEARDALNPSPEGMPALSPQLAQLLGAYGSNLVVSGSFESWSSGTTSAPDGWTLTGAGATIARNTTASQLQDGLASVSLTAALNTATDLAQAITISTTQNLRLRGREVTFSARVRAGTADRVFLRLDDGVVTKDSRYHVGNGAFETLAVTMTVDSAATKIEASCEISSGASITAQFDAAKLEEGAQATAFVPNSRDPFVQSRAAASTTAQSITTQVWTNVTGMSVANVIVDGTQSVIILCNANIISDTANKDADIRIVRGSTQVQDFSSIFLVTANKGSGAHLTVIDVKPAAGIYTYGLQWQTEGTGETTSWSRGHMTVTPIPSA